MSKPPRSFWLACVPRLLLRLLLIAGMIWLWQMGYSGAAVGLLFGTIVLFAYMTLSPSTQLLGPVLTRSQDGQTWLTIDDGPHPDTTPGVLDLLDEYDTKAVFFLIGQQVQHWPELAKEIQRRGHEIGNHTQTHPAQTYWALSPLRTWAEISQCQATLQEVLGVVPRWFRAPAGHFQAFTHPAAQALGLEIMGWSCRGYDGLDPSVPRVLKRIRAGLSAGGIVLVHEARPSSLAVLQGVLAMLQELKKRCQQA
jgi:peptidoglycan-N-acetylglucosamine deacetylase